MNDPKLQQLPHTVIASWYQRQGYVTAMADLIQQSLQQFQEQVSSSANSSSQSRNVYVKSETSSLHWISE